ncbi:arylsulfatase [Microbacterium sp.]|uniref:arylsulfatase n=1 Tax=Microbacterium sp. TaxID=51671 RepID=UPI003A87BA8A
MQDADDHLHGVDGANPRGYEGFEGVVAPDISESTPWWPQPARARAGAPNVVVMLIDDMGFSDIAPFGSEIATPGLSALAAKGYRFSNFRVTPLCSPSRAALLTGANPHRAGFGYVSQVDPGYPGLSMQIPHNLPTLAESFRDNGYATFMVGKWHLTRESEMHDGADKSSWPVQRGFDRYFGSLDGYTTLYHPHRLVRDNSPVTEEFGDDDYLTDRLTDEAIGMIGSLRTGSDRPFFLYFAHHAMHGPVQAKPADIERHRGAYEQGWDAVRQARFRRQLADGLFPPGTQLSPSGPEITDGVPAWDDLDDEQRALFARHMEVYAGAVSAIDDSVTRLIEHLTAIGEYDNTIIVFCSDNGGTGEGGVNGTRSYFSQFFGHPDIPSDWVADVPRPLELMGGPRVHGHYPRGWAHASNTPFRMYKGQVWEGGVHSPLIVSWPGGLPRRAGDTGVRDGFAYITDIAPTVLELAGAHRPERLQGAATVDADGASFADALRLGSAAAPRPGGQHISLMRQHTYYRGQWKLIAPQPTDQSIPFTTTAALDWQLFDIIADPTELTDVASRFPDVVAELAEEYRRTAWFNTVFPMVHRRALDARPSTEARLAEPVRIAPGLPTMERFRSARLVRMRSFVVEATLVGAPGEGVLVSHGDQGGGYILWLEGGRLHLSYNAYGDMHRVSTPFAESDAVIVATFTALDGLAWGIEVRSASASLRLDRVTMLAGMAPFTGISVGFDGGGPVDWDVHERHGRFPYRGGLRDVRYVPGEPAPYDNETLVAVDEITGHLLD